MKKIIQTLLLVLTVSIAVAARLSILGWLGFMGIGSALILGIGHFYIHFYSMNSLSVRSKTNIFKILLSHFLFLNLFFFQSDADDSRSYLVFEYVFGKEDTGLTAFSNAILFASFLLYIGVAIWIIAGAKKERLAGSNHTLLIPSIIITLFLPFVLIRAFTANQERQYERKQESTGEYSEIKRAIRHKEKVRILRINSYEFSYSTFPKEIMELENLVELYLNEQKIKSIPDDIGKLKNLEILDLVDNDINEINPSICNCRKLKDLRIGGTAIQTLPGCLTSLDSLHNLTIQSNTVNDLMDELRKFKTLKTAHFYTKGILFDREKWWKLSKELGIE